MAQYKKERKVWLFTSLIIIQVKMDISIILPVYNAEVFLEKCIISILEQSYDDFELIIINDGSTDHSESIIEKYLDNKRIRYYQQENRGVSHARNVAMSTALGKYIIFVDADDELPKDSLKMRIDDIKGSDMLIASYNTINERDDIVGRMPLPSTNILTRKEALTTLISKCEIGYQGYLWNKMFRTDIIKNNNIQFDSNIYYGEDRLFVAEYLMHSNVIRVSKNTVYSYRENSSGAMKLFYNLDDNHFDRLISEFLGFNKLEFLLKGYDVDLHEIVLRYKMDTVVLFLKNSNNKSKRIRKQCLLIGWSNMLKYFKCKTKNIPCMKKVKMLGHLILMR